ncbi:MAG: hypothetical protein R3C53_10290 [Pirellulaceae bacterium]
MSSTVTVNLSTPMFAQTRVVYQWARLEQIDQWWHWLLVAFVVTAIAVFVVYWYLRDSVEHRRPVGWALLLLRMGAFVGILLYFFQFDRRTEQRVVRDSRVAVLVDTSLSMSLPGTPSAVGVASSLSRAAEAAQLIGQTNLLEQLSSQHEVSVYRFDQTNRPIQLAALDKSLPQATEAQEASSSDAVVLGRARAIMLVATILSVVAVVMLVVSLTAQLSGARQWHVGAWLLLGGSVLSVVALGISAFALVPTTRYPLAAILGADLPPLVPASESTIEVDEADALQSLPESWSEALLPAGIETRLGDAIKAVLDKELGNPLAGVVVLTDGRNNAGVEPRGIIASAQNARVPLYVIGLGSDRSPPNLEVVEIDVPRRLYPGDRFSFAALIGSSGFAGRVVTVQVLSGPKNADSDALSIEAEEQIEVPADGSLATARFELQPKTVGQWQYVAKVIPLADDADASDNMQSTTVEVIERKNRVLVFAGGPTREYQFVRNLLYRDKDVESHVLLQSGSRETSQESQKLLREFPANRAALSEYDAILAFDADWTKVPDSSVLAVEQWVAEQAGGMLLVAGSVEMPKWIARSAQGSRAQYLRSLSPVVLDQRGSALLAAGRVESESAWPLTITPEGQQTDFLWLSDNPQTSLDIWQSGEGVHTFYSAYELKPGAKALALFSDPTSAVDGQLPIYIASQFYGSGRVVFQGGGELWRLRSQGDQYFDRYYTKLVRWISQGRLLLDSDRGMLLVDREEALLGEQVIVRAVLKNERYEPLVQSEVVARLLDPQGRNLPLTLRPLSDGSQPGVYTGQFPLLVQGGYRVQLQLGGIASQEVLQAEVQAKVPAMEMQHAERHDQLLTQLALETGGKYWRGADAALKANSDMVDNPNLDNKASGQLSALAAAIVPQDQVAYLPGAPDRVFQIRWLGWLMTLIAGCLSLEWLARRLHRLA